jgi:hypothetical protein
MDRTLAKPLPIPLPTPKQVIAWTGAMAALSIVLQIIVGA